MLRSMGLRDNAAKKALAATHNESVDKAVNWYFEHSDDPDIDEPIKPNSSRTPFFEPQTQAFSSHSDMDTRYKLVLCVRGDLNMSVGKIAAQCCHATLGTRISIFTP